MSRRQDFHGAVGQVVQTRHFSQRNFSTPEPPESQLQAEFIKNTGISDSNREARAQLDWLMAEHRFNLPELRHAWRAGSLAWDKKRKRWYAKLRWLDLLWGGSCIAALALLLAASLTLVVMRMPLGDAMAGAAVLSVLLCGAIAYFVSETSIVPQRIARRVDEAYTRTTKSKSKS